MRGPLGDRTVPLGCRDGACGACRVLVDGALVTSCRLTVDELPPTFELALPADHAETPAAREAMAAFDRERPTRCSMCVGALGLAAAWIAAQPAAERPRLVDETTRGAWCACTGRRSLRRALEAGAEAPAPGDAATACGASPCPTTGDPSTSG